MLTAHHSVTQTLCANDHAACIALGHWLHQQLIVAPYNCAVHRLEHLLCPVALSSPTLLHMPLETLLSFCHRSLCSQWPTVHIHSFGFLSFSQDFYFYLYLYLCVCACACLCVGMCT